MRTYKIVRFYFRRDQRKRTIATGLTLQEAQEHCRDPESSWKTARSAAARRRLIERGEWFDGYVPE